VFGRTPVWVRSGGSIPVVSEFQRLFGIPTVLMGFASPGDNLHGPNEKFSLRNFKRGILTSIAFLDELGSTHNVTASPERLTKQEVFL
jgi:acetylornithine deacetylase/succinyl-diaminopimelate desuccinylase-like protein